MIWRLVTCFSLAVLTVHGAAVSGTVSLRDSRVDSVNKRRDYSGIVISLIPVNGGIPPVPPKRATMNQKAKMFMPHVLPVLAGTTVDFPNFDPIFHSAFSSYNGQIFDVGLYPPGSTKSVRFTKTGVVRVFCNIHPSMSAVILVLGTPYFTTTEKNGSFEIDVPPGNLRTECLSRARHGADAAAAGAAHPRHRYGVSRAPDRPVGVWIPSDPPQE